MLINKVCVCIYIYIYSYIYTHTCRERERIAKPKTKIAIEHRRPGVCSNKSLRIQCRRPNCAISAIVRKQTAPTTSRSTAQATKYVSAAAAIHCEPLPGNTIPLEAPFSALPFLPFVPLAGVPTGGRGGFLLGSGSTTCGLSQALLFERANNRQQATGNRQ